MACWVRKPDPAEPMVKWSLERRFQSLSRVGKAHDAKIIDRNLRWAKGNKKAVLFFADAGYTDKKITENLLDADIPTNICEKGCRGASMTEDQKQSNKIISSLLNRIEHAFGFIEESLVSTVVMVLRLLIATLASKLRRNAFRLRGSLRDYILCHAIGKSLGYKRRPAFILFRIKT